MKTAIRNGQLPRPQIRNPQSAIGLMRMDVKITATYVAGQYLDWEHLLNRVADDARLMAGVLAAFIWLCPGRARKLPPWLWRRVG